MPTVAEVLDGLDAIAPMDKAAGWDPTGLQVGDRSAPVRRLALCHEVTEAVVAALEADPVDLLVTYHPLLFAPERAFVAGRDAAGRAYRLARRGVSLAVVHTAFDGAPGGTADALAAALGLSAVRGFGPLWGSDQVKVVVTVPAPSVETTTAALAAAGAGRIGRYSSCSFRQEGTGTFLPGERANPAVGAAGEPSIVDETRIEMTAPAARRDAIAAALVAAHPYEEPAFDFYPVAANAAMAGRFGTIEPMSLRDLAASVASRLGSGVRVAGDLHGTVASVAVLPGSGATFIADAARHADVLVTGDVSHHRAREALERGLAVIDAGHIPTERPGLEALYAEVSALAPTVERIDLDPHPWEDL